MYPQLYILHLSVLNSYTTFKVNIEFCVVLNLDIQSTMQQTWKLSNLSS